MAVAPDSASDPPSDVPDPSAPEQASDVAGAEGIEVERVTAVLTATLDRLGAAHHRPFSRA